MIKLKLAFQTTLDVSKDFNGLTSLTKLIPFKNGRAIAFGWGINERIPESKFQYWLAELTIEGQVTRVLQRELTHRKELLSGLNDDNQVQAFKFGEQFGLLLSTEIILLFSSISDEPVVIPIQNHFSFLGQPRFDSHVKDSYYVPTHCGNSDEGVVPVVIRHPKEHDCHAGRYLALLRIDEDLKSASWVEVDADGSPKRTNIEDYRKFPMEHGHGGIHIATERGKTYYRKDLPPVISECARIDNEWYVYAAGYDPSFIRYGIPLGTLTKNDDALAITELIVRPLEQCYGTICASLDRVIFSPLRANGARKGKQSIFTLSDEIDYPISMPRGFAKYQVQEYLNGLYWLTPMQMGYNRMPTQIAACVEIT
ncbi:hypothetical protein RF679_05325 [Undibacterium cyanobacteriorum]|uniref:Uncharacterized protein n=1 Tax=Undibacterium cyanobacteriorum TaxID=3073561 RepID=A0ABY9RNX2_9BURK|nr:hypothetical protein [Undibacterium sp. 20NA77.5]WMW81701.1 hypothetical protein RF679_05325 [Undibacterium sp. 20NA77.5]